MKTLLQLIISFNLMLICLPFSLSSQNQPSLKSAGVTAIMPNTVRKPDSGTCGTMTYGGLLYHSVVIGSQCWMKENLNIGKWLDQSQLQKPTDNGLIEKYCYGNDFVQCDVWGGLYQWDEMMLYSEVSGAQGICPDGWHIPTSQDWKNLIRFLGGNLEAGGKMKSTGSID